MAEDFLQWLHQTQTFKADVDYRDPTPTPPLVVTPDTDLSQKATDNQHQIEQKEFGKDTRATLAQWIMCASYMFEHEMISLKQFQTAINTFEAVITNRQESVEQRETDLEERFKDVISKITKDGEVIDARRSLAWHLSFKVLRDRLEYDENFIRKYLPSGSEITIKHNLGRVPTVAVDYYEYPIGCGYLPPDGVGAFGTTPIDLNVSASFPDNNTAKIIIPAQYELEKPTLAVSPYDKTVWYLSATYKTIGFKFN